MKRPILILLLLLPLRLEAQSYLAVGVAVDSARHVTLHDTDCSSTQPPALFGCGTGNDGRSFGARGDLRRSKGFELALGRELGRARAEIRFASRTGSDLDAHANFTGVTGEQPVSASVRSLSLLAAGAVDLAPPGWRVRPFLTAGAGVARNEMGSVTFAFPGISSDAVTVTRGGRATGLAWSGGAGLTIALARGLSLDVTARYSDLGRIRGDRGDALIVRPTRTLHLDIAPTQMTWRTRGVSVSIRREF